jgi:hypothetical protein
MTEKWKHQIKIGLIWSFSCKLIITLGTFAWLREVNFDELFSINYIFRFIVFILIGIFIVGNSSWKSKIKTESI